MKERNKQLIFWIFILVSGVAMGQDPNYSQFLNNPLYYNPAYTGLYNGAKARLSFRDQWPVLPYDFKSYHFDAELGDRNLPGSGGAGFFLNTDNEGIGFIRNFNLGVSLAVRIPFSKLAVGQLGIKASWLQKSVNWDDFVFSDELSERYGLMFQSGFIRPEQDVRNMADFGVGGILQFGNDVETMTGTFGMAIDHLFEPDQSFLQTAKAPIPRKWVGHADFIFSVGSSTGMGRRETGALRVNPGAIYQSQAGQNSIQAGLNIAKYGVIVGMWYKGSTGNHPNSSLVFLAGYGLNYADNMGLKFTYSYDMQMAGELMGTGGAHEISLILEFNSASLINGYASPMRGGHWEGQTPWECAEFW